MSIWTKLKGALFEEEEYEVEEEVVETKKKPRKAKKTNSEVKVAKKIDLPEQQKVEPEPEVKAEEEDYIEEETYSSRIEKEQKFNIEFDESDFQEEIKEEAPKKWDLPSWKDAPKEEPANPYEGNKEKQIFKPTPIISPIYGILDKNYKKEDVITKKELRLSTTSSRRPTLEKVREKAYGDLSSDFEESFETLESKEQALEETKEIEITAVKEEAPEKTVIDLNKGDAPAVESVTVGDAEEYFDELGLEYNVDYKDDSIEKTKVKRRSEKLTEVKEEAEEKEEIIEEVEDVVEEDNGDNLFDLIEAMYEDEEDV